MNERNESFLIEGNLYLPFFNRWGELSYKAEAAFTYDPFEIAASSTSGSPVAFTQSLFIGFLNDSGGRFTYDGEFTLTVILPEGQELFVRTGMDPFEAWEAYNAQILPKLSNSSKSSNHLYRMVEYSTWVEQKAAGNDKSQFFEVLSETFVDRYLDRLAKLNLPFGKFTIDDGWYDKHSETGSGTIEPNKRFPDLKRMARKIESAGHVPGIWLDLGCVSSRSRYYQEHSDKVKPHSVWGSTEVANTEVFYQALAGTQLERQFRNIFERLIDAGFVKFKVDMLYGNKREMKEILALAHRVAHEIRGDVELESHIPDIFVSPFCDVVRTNDVLISADSPWRELTWAHWTVSYYSAPNHWLNLDHIGGNNPAVSEEDFVSHLNMFERVPGHPVVSLLPDRYSPDTQKRLKQILHAYENNKHNPDYFINIPKFLG